MQYDLQYIFKNTYKETTAAISVEHHRKRELSCTIYPNATVVPHWGERAPLAYESGGVVDCENKPIQSSKFISQRSVRIPSEDEINYNDLTAIYIGCIVPIYGHMMTDNIKHIWFLHTKECADLLREGAILVYVTFFSAEMPAWALEMLKLAGVDLDKVQIVRKATKFKNVYVPDESMFDLGDDSRGFNDNYLETIQYIKSRVKPDTSYPKLYFTRTQLSNNKDKDGYGEKELEQYFRQAGYAIVTPEKHTVSEQIAMLMGCKVFAATEGSISHNAIFCEPGTKHIILRKFGRLLPHTTLINEAANLDVTIIDVNKSIRCNPKEPWLGPFYIYKTKEFCKYFNLNKKECVWLKWSWWKYYIVYSALSIYFLRSIKYLVKRTLSSFSLRNA